MLIDWLTLILDRTDAPDWSGWGYLEQQGDRIMRYCPKTGSKVWEVPAWDTVRSDSHQITIRCSGSKLVIQGSPARCLGDGDTVFGVGDEGRDVVACAKAMMRVLTKVYCIFPLPDFRLWKLTRIDVTCNFLLASLAEVRCALAELRNVEGGRYRVSQQAGDTVYWSHQSTVRSGKAYAKGPHLKYLLNQDTYKGRSYNTSELKLAERLIRLELRLGRHFLRKQDPWYTLTWDFFYSQHESYFGRMIGDDSIGVADMSMIERISQVAESEGQAQAVSRTWAIIQVMGWEGAKASMRRSTWYLHLAVLRKAGLGDADISAGRVVSLRRRLVLQPVSSWDDLRRVA